MLEHGARTPASRDALADALAELRADFEPAPDEPDDRYWLRVGLRLGLTRPGRAQLMLDRLEGVATAAERDDGPGAEPAPGPDGRPVAAPGPGGGGETGAETGGETGAQPDARDAPDALRPGGVSVRSMLLARAAALPLDEPAETAFGWIARLSSDEVLAMGRLVGVLVADGASANLGRGFGLAWTAGARIPNSELNALFARFQEVELAVAGVLAGHDLHGAAQHTRPSLSEAIQGWLMPSSSRVSSEVTGVLERLGAPAQLGLIAVWNTWAAVRYRASIPTATFDELVKPWTSVVGPLPHA